MTRLPRPTKPISLFLGALTAFSVGGTLLSGGLVLGLAVADPTLRPIGWAMVLAALTLAVARNPDGALDEPARGRARSGPLTQDMVCRSSPR